MHTGTSVEWKHRSNAEWIAALTGEDNQQAVALTELHTYLLRAALFTLRRALRYVGHLESSTIAQIAEDCAQEALTSILHRLQSFRGDSRFTTWAYAFAVNIALTAARRERWSSVGLDGMLENGASRSAPVRDDVNSPDPERRTLQTEIVEAIRDGIEHHLTLRQQEALRAVVFEGVPLDEVVRRWGTNRNAVYKLVHDARRKLKSYLAARGFDVKEMLDAFKP